MCQNSYSPGPAGGRPPSAIAYNRGMMETFRVRTRQKAEVVDITARVAEVVRRAGADEGICTVFVRHATAAIVINENADPGFRLDLVAALDKLFPEGIWEHDKVDDNGAAHLKAAVLGPSETIPIRGGRLLLGTWQGIALVECDGPREREVVVHVRG
jgi:secondary thiamine-phosphate synthase enzyme